MRLVAASAYVLIGSLGTLPAACTLDQATILAPAGSEDSTATDWTPPSVMGESSSSDDGGSNELGDQPRLDLPPPNPTANCGDLDGDGQLDFEFSHIWIANSQEGTVSKIDTQTATELARYRTGPPGTDPDPSRTSVNLWGDVAVLNRAGSVLKIAARESDCIDFDADGEIETSRSATQVLAFGDDECVLWSHELPFVAFDGHRAGPRGLAWDNGEGDPCESPTGTEHLWVGWGDASKVATIVRLRGDDGEQDFEVEIPGWECEWDHGIYGAVADREGDLWALGTHGTLVHVDSDTLEVRRHENPERAVVYGIAVDAWGTPWMAGWDGRLWSFDTDAKRFVDRAYFGGILGPITGTQGRGMAVDRVGIAWIAANDPPRLVRYDTVLDVGPDDIDLPSSVEPVGVAVDAEGFVWVVDRGANRAFKVHPITRKIVATVTGLVAPYSYSDMTGSALKLVTFPPTG